MPKGGIGHHGHSHLHSHGYGMGIHNRHMFHHSSYNRRVHNNYGQRPGPTVIFIPGNSGGIWIPRHRVFQSEMRMWIELVQNRVSYNVGEWVEGRVLCNFQESFDTNLLVLSFVGNESTWTNSFRVPDSSNLVFSQQWVLFQIP